MPAKRETLFDAAIPLKGLWLEGAKEKTPPGYLRRARGIHHTNSRVLRSRAGSTADAAIANAHSLFRFSDVRFQAASTVLYRAGSSLVTGLSGNRLSFARMPPALGLADSLFFAEGSVLRKIDSGGTATNWGIAAPTTALTAAFGGLSRKEIALFNDHTAFTSVSGVTSKADEATIAVDGGTSMLVSVAANTTAIVEEQSLTLDLSTVTGGGVSPDEDWIEFWFRVNNPDHLDRIELAFSLGNTDFSDDVYSRAFYVSNAIQPFSGQDQSQALGIADTQDVFFNQSRLVAGSYIATQHDKLIALENITQTDIPNQRDVWIQLRPTKSSFTRSGNGSEDWSDVQAMRLTIVTNGKGSVTTYWDQMYLHGRFGHQGIYTYAYTYRNTTTGNRSNASPTTEYGGSEFTSKRGAAREQINLSAITVSTDSQVNQREVWRTMGNGSLLFRADTLDNNSATTLNDIVADFVGLDSSGNDILENLELPTDNDPPDSTHFEIMADTQNVMWWLNNASGLRGRAYFSPAGRPESQKDFIDVTNNDDPLQRLVIFQGRRYAISEASWFELRGSDPYTSVKLDNIPGVLTANKNTLVVTNLGVIWQAADGLRIYAGGSTSRLIADEQLGSLFRGENLENLTAFEGITADYGSREYLISDGNQTLGINFETGFIRDLGFGATALYYEEDTAIWLAGKSTQVELIEVEGQLSDDGMAITFEIEPGSLDLSDSPGASIQRFLIDINPNGQTITPTSIIDDNETTLPPLTGANRTEFEYAIAKKANRVGLRLEGSLTAQVQVYKIEADIYRP